MSTDSAPAARVEPQYVWTGKELLIWGGITPDLKRTLDDGAKYDPTTDRWTPIAKDQVAPAVWGSPAVWTGREMLIWSGSHQNGDVNINEVAKTGAAYDPVANTWRAIATEGAPSPRFFHTSVWTGSKLIVWAGGNQSPASTIATAESTMLPRTAGNPSIGKKLLKSAACKPPSGPAAACSFSAALKEASAPSPTTPSSPRDSSFSFPRLQPNYIKALDRLRGAGCVCIGYVFTSYAKRPLADVKKELATWQKLYPAIQGVFFDEMIYEDTDAGVKHQLALNEYANNIGLWPTVANPGTDTPGRYFQKMSRTSSWCMKATLGLKRIASNETSSAATPTTRLSLAVSCSTRWPSLTSPS